jgi:hypothetical protein
MEYLYHISISFTETTVHGIWLSFHLDTLSWFQANLVFDLRDYRWNSKYLLESTVYRITLYVNFYFDILGV